MEETTEYTMIEIQPANYWLSNTALHITLNAMGLPDYMQMNVSTGAVFACYASTVGDLGFDAGHNYKRWQITAMPTYFSSKSEKYAYVAVPRGGDTSKNALIAFPSERIDLYGKNAAGTQVGSTEYYYVWLHAVITASADADGVEVARQWKDGIGPDCGTLATEESFIQGGDSTWWKWNSVSDTITFIKDIASAAFRSVSIGTGSVKRTVSRIFNSEDAATLSADTKEAANQDTGVATAGYINIFGNKHFIRKDADDFVDAVITFGKKDIHQSGSQFGKVYNQGLYGQGANIDAEGNAEFETVTARGSFTASEFIFNKILVVDGAEIMSHANGTIDSIRIDRSGLKVIRLKLEGNEFGEFKSGDRFQGMYNTLGVTGVTYVPIDAEGSTDITDKSVDRNGFYMRKGFYTAYAQVTSIVTDNVYDAESNSRIFEFSYQNMDGWTDANGVEIEPCPLMKIAAYSHPNDTSRQGFHYRSTIGRNVYIIYQHVDGWKVHPWNILKAFGEIAGLQIAIGGSDSEVRTLESNGTYEAGSYYFGGTMENLSPTTYDDILKKLQGYEVTLSKGTDNIVVDSVGNVIGGYWSEVETEDETTHVKTVHRTYRLSTAVTVHKHDGTLLLLNGSQHDDTKLVGEGEFAVYATGSDCTPMVKDGVVYIVGINNIHDGTATTHDDIDFDAMRAMKECVVSIAVDCEGIGVRNVDFHVVINHQNTAFIAARMDNEMVSVSYNTKTQKYLGLPATATAHMLHNNDTLVLNAMKCSKTFTGLIITTDAASGLLTVAQSAETTEDVISDNTIIPIDVSTIYSGVSYEQTLYFKLSKSSDGNSYALNPSATVINAVRDENNEYVYSEGGKVSCGVQCTSTDDGIYDMTSEQLQARGIKMQYSYMEDNNGDAVDDRTYSDYDIGTQLDIKEHNEVSFRIVRVSDSYPIDKQTIPVVRGGLNGVDGIDFEYVFCRQTAKPTAPDYTGANKITDSYTDAKGVVWYDHPQGIDDLHPQEWMSFRTSVNADNGSKTFKGQIFGHVQSWEADGDGLEYIYAINNRDTAPTLDKPSNYETSSVCQADDYVPTGWFDNNQVNNISDANRYCWRSWRKKKSGGNWAWFITPRIAAYKADDAVSFDCSPSTFIIRTDKIGVPVSAGSQTFVLTATKKGSALTAGIVGIKSHSDSNMTLNTDTAGKLVVSWNAAYTLSGDVISAEVTFKDGYGNYYSHTFVITIALAQKGEDGDPGIPGIPGGKGDDSVSYLLKTNTDVVSLSLGADSINWGNSISDDPSVIPSKVTANYSSLTCAAYKSIGDADGVAYSGGYLCYCLHYNGDTSAYLQYTGAITVNGKSYYNVTSVEFRLYTDSGMTVFLASHVVHFEYETSSYFSKMKDKVVAAITDQAGSLVSYMDMDAEGIKVSGNTIRNTSADSIFNMMVDKIADKALELIAKNSSYDIIKGNDDMSDWDNYGATISQGTGYKGYGAYMPDFRKYVNGTNVFYVGSTSEPVTGDSAYPNGTYYLSDGSYVTISGCRITYIYHASSSGILPNVSYSSYRDYMQKSVKLKQNTMYMLSFWAKSDVSNGHISTYVYPDVNARIISISTGGTADSMTSGDTCVAWSLTAVWTQYMVVFRSLSNLDETTTKLLLFRLWNDNGNITVSNVELRQSSYLEQALSGSTEIMGGLILSNLIAARNNDGKVSTYLNGIVGDTHSPALSTGVKNFGTDSETRMSQVNHDGSARFGNFEIDTNGDVWIVDSDGVQRIKLLATDLPDLATLVNGVGQTSSTTIPAKSINNSGYGGYSGEVTVLSGIVVTYDGSTVSCESIKLTQNITAGNGGMTASLVLIGTDNTRSYALLSRTVNGQGNYYYTSAPYASVQAGMYNLVLQMSYGSGNSYDITASINDSTLYVKKTIDNMLNTTLAKDGFANIYGANQYVYVKNGVLSIGSPPVIRGTSTSVLFAGEINAYGGMVFGDGVLFSYTAFNFNRDTANNSPYYNVGFYKALKSTNYTVLATAMNSNGQDRFCVIKSKTASGFIIFVDNVKTAFMTDSVIQLTIIGDYNLLTQG